MRAHLSAVGVAAEHDGNAQFGGGEDLGWIVHEGERERVVGRANALQKTFRKTRTDDAEGANSSSEVDRDFDRFVGKPAQARDLLRALDEAGGVVIAPDCERAEARAPGVREFVECNQGGGLIAWAGHEIAGEEDEISLCS